MNRLWAPLLLLLIPGAASAQSNIPLFDANWTLVPEACRACPCGAGGALQFVQNVMNALVSFGILICVLVVVFAGFLWILTPTNPESHSQAKKVLTNAVIGFIIILSAWLVVDFVMKLLYDGESTFGPWNEILTLGGDACIEARDVKPLFSGDIVSAPGLSVGGAGGVGSVEPRYTTSGACSPTAVGAAGQSSGTTEKEATFLACIARPESTCGTKLLNYNWGKGSSAYGPYQILLDGNARYFENAACRQAAGIQGNGLLGCSAGFRNGNPVPGSAIARRCMKAASDLACSTAAATALIRDSGATPWTGNNDSKPAHQRCALELR